MDFKEALIQRGGAYSGGRRLGKKWPLGELIRGEALIRGGGAYLGKYGIQN